MSSETSCQIKKIPEYGTTMFGLDKLTTQQVTDRVVSVLENLILQIKERKVRGAQWEYNKPNYGSYPMSLSPNEMEFTIRLFYDSSHITKKDASEFPADYTEVEDYEKYGDEN